MTMQFWKDVTEILQHVFAVLAILGGGVWTYFNFIKGRTYKPTLALSIHGMIKTARDSQYLDVKVVVKNVGRAKFDISRQGTALIIWEASPFPAQEFAFDAIWEELATYPVLEGQSWIEPSETVEDQLLIVLPAHDRVACKVEMRIAADSQVWKGATIIPGL